MQTQKVQITLTPEEVAALSLKSTALGYKVTKYIKFIVMKEAYSVIESIPTLAMSPALEKKVLKTQEEHRHGRTKRLKKIEDLDTL